MTMTNDAVASNDWEATRVEKGKLLKRDLILKIIKRPPLSTFTQLIKRKLLLLSADGESKRDWFGLVGAADQSASSGSHFKLRRLDECVWWRVCHSKVCRIKSQSDFPWEGLKITGDKKEKGAHIRSLDKGQRQHTNKDIKMSWFLKEWRRVEQDIVSCSFAAMLPMIEKLLGWKKENYLKRFDPKNHKEASTVHFTQLIKGKLLLLSADGDWSAWWGRQTRALSSGSHFKLRLLDQCGWRRVCHSKVCRIKSQRKKRGHI